MNNWLGFSLSPHHQQQDHDQCFDLTSAHDDSTIPSLNLPPPFGILEAFNTNPNTQSQDWNMREMSMNTYSCSNQETPKLENFLGRSFIQTQQEQNKLQTPSNPINDNNYSNIYQETVEPNSHTNTIHDIDDNNSAMGLSMIKNWLRNNPPPASHAVENKEEVVAAPPPGPMVAGSQSLSLSMSTGGSQSDKTTLMTNNNGVERQSGACAIESVQRKSVDTFGQRTSIYRGVTRHRWTGRYEAHLWDNSCRREGQTRKGRQVYLGGYDKEDKAARAYDLTALKYWGTPTTTNFPISNYEKEMEEMKHMTRQEYVASLRRKSSGFSRGASIYRGVTRHHQQGRWQARIGRVAGNKDLYLGTFSTQEEAAEAYDIAAIKFRGLNAVTNFEINRYDVKTILDSTTLPIGGAAKRLKDAEMARSHINNQPEWPCTIASFQQPLNMMYPFAHQTLWCKQEQHHDINEQIQMGNNTRDFMQNGPEFSTFVYDGPVMGNGGISFHQENKGVGGYEGMFGSISDNNGYHHQQARNMYHQQSSSSSNGMAKVADDIYDPGSTFNENWIPSGAPVCHGASTFTAWNDA